MHPAHSAHFNSFTNIPFDSIHFDSKNIDVSYRDECERTQIPSCTQHSSRVQIHIFYDFVPSLCGRTMYGRTYRSSIALSPCQASRTIGIRIYCHLVRRQLVVVKSKSLFTANFQFIHFSACAPVVLRLINAQTPNRRINFNI